MDTAVLVFHPNLESSTVNRALCNALDADTHMHIRKEYDLYPDFNINPAAEQDYIDAHDRIIFLFPTYWYQAPALMKEWLDTVLAPGWAYEGGQALKDKPVRLITSYGGDTFGFEARSLLSPYEATFRYLGAEYHSPELLLNTAYCDTQKLSSSIAQIADHCIASQWG